MTHEEQMKELEDMALLFMKKLKEVLDEDLYGLRGFVGYNSLLLLQIIRMLKK